MYADETIDFLVYFLYFIIVIFVFFGSSVRFQQWYSISYRATFVFLFLRGGRNEKYEKNDTKYSKCVKMMKAM